MMDAENPEPTAGLPKNDAAESPAELSPEDWEKSEALGRSEPSPREMASYASTVRRIERTTLFSGLLCAVAFAWPLGWLLALGIVVGTVLGWINFRWLAASVNAIGERIVKTNSGERGATVAWRGVGRIALIALFAYVIFTYSVRGLIGFLAGLTMPVFAMMYEAAYEFIAGKRRIF